LVDGREQGALFMSEQKDFLHQVVDIRRSDTVAG
jgi:hypothetical protein